MHSSNQIKHSAFRREYGFISTTSTYGGGQSYKKNQRRLLTPSLDRYFVPAVKRRKKNANSTVDGESEVVDEAVGTVKDCDRSCGSCSRLETTGNSENRCQHSEVVHVSVIDETNSSAGNGGQGDSHVCRGLDISNFLDSKARARLLDSTILELIQTRVPHQDLALPTRVYKEKKR